MDEVSVVGLSGVQRKTRLLSAVRDQIAVDRNKFQNLQALRKQLPLKDVADRLETIYNDCGMCAGGRGVGLVIVHVVGAVVYSSPPRPVVWQRVWES